MSDSLVPAPVTACGGCWSRREFLGRAALAVLATSVVQACNSLATEPAISTATTGVSVVGTTVTIDLTKATDLTKSAGAILVGTSYRPVLVVNAGGGSYHAFDARCPHQGQYNGWGYDGTTLTCQFHGSTFTNAGVVEGGPSPSSLVSLPSSLSGTTLTISVG